MKNSIFILSTVLLFSEVTFNQEVTSQILFDKLYFKAGAEFYSMSRGNSNVKGDVNNINLAGSIIYDYLDNVQMEFVYKYGFERTYPIYDDSYKSGGEIINIGKSEGLTDYNIDFKLNYFLNKDETVNPIYLTGILEFDIQNRSVHNIEMRFDTNGYNQKYYNFDISSYNRLLAGPGLGAGIFLAFGKVDFQAEVSSVLRVAPFVDSGYRELLLNVFAGLVYKF